MTNTVKIPRAYLALGVCLPLAVLLGYLVAEPLESSSVAAIVLIFSVLATPLLMKWYHPILILSWNACVTPYFFPGQFSLWILMACIGFFFAILNRATNPHRKLINIRSVTIPLLFIGVVVLVTALLTGGVGVQSLGGAKYGGSRYVYIFAAIAGYFALTSRRIPPHRAATCAAMFFLPGLTALVSNLAYALGPSFYFLYYLFPAGGALEQAAADYSMDQTILRLGGLMPAVPALYGYLLSRYGLRGTLNSSKPLRVVFFLAALIGCLATGFRFSLILFLFIIVLLFYFEGLHRTRWLAAFLAVAVLGAFAVLPYAYKLPLPVQRTLSFLPANVDTLAMESANSSTDWRLNMWREVLPEIPQYLLKGKGYSIDPDVLKFGSAIDRFAVVKAAGDYHNGPLSILIPLGIFGLIGFVWFLAASIRALHRYARRGAPELRTFNTFLLAIFLAKTAGFFLVFGSFFSELFEFTGLIGLAISLNGPFEISNEVETSESNSSMMLSPQGFRDRRIMT